MNSQDFKENICRICLDEAVVLDWNETLYTYLDVTYKDCYYKYTQLECHDTDWFSSKLCQICVDGLQNVHTLVLKALESHTYFQEKNLPNTHKDNPINLEDIKYKPTEFETLLVQKIGVEPIIQDHFVYEDSNEEFNVKPVKTRGGRSSKRKTTATSIAGSLEKLNKRLEKRIKIEKKTEERFSVADSTECNLAPSLNTSCAKTRRKASGKSKLQNQIVVQDDNISISLGLDDENISGKRKEEIRDEPLDQNIEDCAEQKEPKVKKKYKEIKKMCFICSKILRNKSALQMHEKTHMENRERNVTCEVCGLKFYDTHCLYSHKRVHKENREKKHKCEFCDKSFYDKGALNVHRRIHLGQMIPCSLCSKQYYRQIDLEKHMISHSAAMITSEAKKSKKCFVRCKYCDKSILSTSFKSHTAAHLNTPLMKCSICNKEYFRRNSCVFHLKKLHQKTNENYNDFIILYKKNRLTRLFLEQTADIQLLSDGETSKKTDID